MFESCSRIIVLHEGENPSTDFYVRSRLVTQKVDVLYLDLKTLVDPELLSGAWIIIVRYCSPKWKRLIEAHQSDWCRLSYFMDDDLFDLTVLPKVYGALGLKWFWLGWRYQFWLRKMDAQLWVSTPYLASKYHRWSPKLLTPRNPYSHMMDSNDSDSDILIFYHGSLSHRGELRWLKEVFESLLVLNPTIQFEVIGGSAVKQLFGSLEQVTVLPPMGWLSYQNILKKPGRTLGLAPLLGGAINSARAPTRFFDVTAAGAVGIYAESATYSGIVRHGDNGLLLPMDKRIWVEQIIGLIDEPKRLRTMYQGALKTIKVE